MSSSVLPEHLAKSARPMMWRRVDGSKASRNTVLHGAGDVLSPPPALDPDAIRRDAYSTGFRDGERQSAENAAARVQSVLDELRNTIDELTALKPRLLQDAEAGLVQLSLAIARRIINRELTVDATAIDGLLRAAIHKSQAQEIYKIRVCREQEAILRGSLERLLDTRKIEIVADDSLKAWDVLFETPSGWLDASVETQFREIEYGFADRLTR